MNTFKNFSAFTLVELIVTITILVILGTIAYMSYNGYSSSSRDSTRISNVSRIKTSLEIFAVNNGKYPIPYNFVDITYSGSTIWNQGTFGDSTFKNVEKLDKIPLDPLSNNEFTYSTTINRIEYQLGTILENNQISYFDSINKSYAISNLEVFSYVSGNYNGKVLKYLSGTSCEVLAIPTIITTYINDDTELSTIISEKKFAYSGYGNLPSSYGNLSTFKNSGFNFSPNKLVVYSDNQKCYSLSNNQENRVILYNEILDSYSGTILNDILVNSGSNESQTLINTSKFIVVNNLGIKVTDSSTGILLTETGSEDSDTDIPDPDDTIPPEILSSGPSGIILTSPVNITINTNENSQCKYSTSNTNYDLMSQTFETTGGTNHLTSYLPSNGENNLYVICKDTSGNTSTTTNITFTYEYHAPVTITFANQDGVSYTCDSCD